jgi:hypothetical protein
MLRIYFATLLLIFITTAVTAEERRPLLNVTARQIPNDTAQDQQTTFSFHHHPALGPKTLKVAFAKGDTFGVKGGRENNWQLFQAVEFNVVNPAEKNVELTLTIRHRKSTNFNTRVDRPLTLKPGKNTVQLKISELKNNDGSAADLSEVTHWYLATQPDEAPTLYFSDILLTGGKTSVAKPEPKTDPARLARIQAAKMPEIKEPVMFNTPAADAILAALEVYPPDNAFNQIVDAWPVHPNSKNIVASVGNEKPLRYNPDMGFIIVPPNQPRVDVNLVGYPGESDKGPYPVPDNTPIEGWPESFAQNGKVPPLAEVQKRPAKYEGDRHAIIIDPVNRKLTEFFVMGKVDGKWVADQASVFDLSSNQLRPDGWTSADAAGLPIFPAVVRFDELERGSIDHALRVTIRRSRRAYVHPATHFASSLTDENLPRMGERFRLRADFPLDGFSPPVKTVLRALKKYGMLVADNGIEWAVSVTPDSRSPNLHAELRKVKGADFEVVVMPE